MEARLQSRLPISALLRGIVVMDLPSQVAQGIFERDNETVATGSKSTQRNNRVSLRMVIGDRQHFAKRPHAMRDPLDDLVRSLASLGEKDLNVGRGVFLLPLTTVPCPVKNHRDRSADRVAVLLKHAHQLITSGGGMTRRTRNQFR